MPDPKFPPVEEYLSQGVDVSMDVDIDDSLFSSGAPTLESSSSLGSNPLPPPPSFMPTADDWQAHMHDPAWANKYARGEFNHEILKEDNLAFDPVGANSPSHHPSSSTTYPYFSTPQFHGGDYYASPKENLDLEVMLKLLKLFLEETAARPAVVEELNPLQLKCIMDLSEKYRGMLPPSSAVAACAQACGL
jgi:hypothetical protein